MLLLIMQYTISHFVLQSITELPKGISVKGGAMTTAQLIDGVNPNGECLEERFHTIMQSLHGTNQY